MQFIEELRAGKPRSLQKCSPLWYAAYNRLQAISEHISDPSSDDSAFKTDDGNYVCAWDHLPESATLLENLKTGRSISFTIETSDFSEMRKSV